MYLVTKPAIALAHGLQAISRWVLNRAYALESWAWHVRAVGQWSRMKVVPYEPAMPPKEAPQPTGFGSDGLPDEAQRASYQNAIRDMQSHRILPHGRRS